MSTRLSIGGRLIDRTKPVSFSFNGENLRGYWGDTLASALLGADKMLLGRSFKYHRPRGLVASGAEEPNALLTLGQGATLEPNQRATMTELFDGLTCVSQNHWPSLQFDISAVNNKLARFLPAGFYYKTFIHPRAAWKHLFEPIIRHSAGLGKPPTEADQDHYEYQYAHYDLVIGGGGIAGLQAALMAGRAGLKVLLCEMTAHWGGRAPVDGDLIDDMPAEEWVASSLSALAAMENVTIRNRMMISGVYDHGYLLAEERLTDHDPSLEGSRKRLWRIRAAKILAATGAIERPLAFAGNDIPGVMLAGAMRDYLANYAVSAGTRCVVVTNNDDAYRTAIAMHQAGQMVAAVIDARQNLTGDLPEQARALGIRVEPGRAIIKALGGKRVTGVKIGLMAGDGSAQEEIACDAIAMSGGWSPVVHLWSHCGGKLVWDEKQALYRPDPARPATGQDGETMVYALGAANGALQGNLVLEDATRVTASALISLKKNADFEKSPNVSVTKEGDLEPVWVMPAAANSDLKAKMWLDYQNDVKVSDVQLAAREGYESVEHTKRYTTIGMATDQGKLSNINGLAIIAEALGKDIPSVGTTTFRPPYTPVTFGALAGEARGEIFQPLRKTPMHDWHVAQGAYMEPVGLWQRPYCYPRSGETHHQAVEREVLNTRNALGLLDASTLGKILVKGPDAGKFLDMLYTNVMSSLPIGKCRYGLMCNEQGFLSDDGVVVRLSEDSWLCHTTSGGADRIHAWMEDWLQCEWWDWQVFTVNLTEQFAQVAVVGPNARKLLEKLGGMDVSKESLPFMTAAEGRLGGFDARIFRISFSGELSYEIAVPANQGAAFWNELIKAGEEFGLMPYGTECLHVLRAEKGFIMIGDETDGTVTPLDLNLNWAVSKKKTDFLGKRGMERSALSDPDRWKLVGFESLDGSVLPEGAYVTQPGTNEYGFGRTQGRITSTYYSPNLKKGVAMGLLKQGPARMGEVVELTSTDGKPGAKARVVDPVFFDPEGERIHG